MAGLKKLKKAPHPRGGARPGAGRKRGGKNAATLEKEVAREVLRQLVTAKLRPLVDAQIGNALGIRFLVTRDKKSGKFVRVVESMAKLRAEGGLKENEELIEVWEKDPSVHAFQDLMNRALDKPAEQPQELKLSGELDLVTRLRSARKRLANATRQATRQG